MSGEAMKGGFNKRNSNRGRDDCLLENSLVLDLGNQLSQRVSIKQVEKKEEIIKQPPNKLWNELDRMYIQIKSDPFNQGAGFSVTSNIPFGDYWQHQ